MPRVGARRGAAPRRTLGICLVWPCYLLFFFYQCFLLSSCTRYHVRAAASSASEESVVWTAGDPALFSNSSFSTLILQQSPAPSLTALSVVSGGTTLTRSGEAVNVSWQGIANPGSYDWIGLYIQGTGDGDLLETFRLYQPTDTGLQEGQKSIEPRDSGWVIIPNVLNIRTPLVVRYFKQEGAADTPTRLAESSPLSFLHLEAEPLQVHLELSDDPNSVKIKFVTNVPAGMAGEEKRVPLVRYGLDPKRLSRLATGGKTTTYRAEDMCGFPANSTTGGYFISPGFFHTVELKRLESRRKYYYQVAVGRGKTEKGSEETVWSEVFDFVSPHGASHRGKVKFIVFGDQGTVFGGRNVSAALTRDLVKDLPDEESPAFLLHIGDISYAWGRGFIWDKWGSQIQPYASRYPYMVSIGNHEYDHVSGADKDPSGAGLGFHPSWGNYGDDSFGECGVPVVHRYSAPSTGHGVWWYSFNYGLAHIIQISTEHDFTPGSTQYQWLQEDLSRVDRGRTPWVILTGHRPMYNSEDYAADWQTAQGIQRALEDLLTQYKVDLALWGHYHSYERTCRVYKGECVSSLSSPGLRHVTVGMAGFDLDNADYMDVPWREVARKGAYGYAMGEVEAEKLVFRAVTATGETIDEFTLWKEGQTPLPVGGKVRKERETKRFRGREKKRRHRGLRRDIAG